MVIRLLSCSTALALGTCIVVWNSTESLQAVRLTATFGNGPARTQVTKEGLRDSHLIESGKSIGQVKLGDSREHVFDALDFESGEEIQTDHCGTEYVAIDKKAHPQG